MLRSTSPVGLAPLALALALAGCNDPPGAAGVRISPDAPTTVDDLVLEVFEPSVDEQGHAISYSITWSRNGSIVEEYADAETIPAAATTRDEVWSVQVVPVDEKDEPGAASEANATILNTAPTVDTLTAAPESPTTESDITATVVSGDVDEDTITTTYAWTVDGGAAGTDSPVLPASAFAKGQAVRLTVTVDDGTDSSTADLDAITVANTPPALAGAALSPTEARVADTITAEPQGWTDVDGDAPAYRYAWTVSGTAAGTESSLTGGFAKGDTITCQVTPFDGEAEGPPVTTAELVVLNTAPAIATVDLDNLSPTTLDSLTATVNGASDADSDAITYTYTWTVDGSTVRTETTSSTTDVLSSDATSKGQAVDVTVVPTDGEDAGEAVSSDIATVVNSVPVMSTVSLAPDPVYTDTDLVATAAATDADGDTLSYTYAWTVNGSSAGGSGSTLSNTLFDKADRVSVSVVALDGDDTSPALTAGPVVVANRPPTAPTIALTPSTPTVSDDLLCSVTVPSTDLDAADTITYNYTWLRGGSTYSTASTTSASVRLAASVTADEDRWQCRVAASDGTDTSATVSSSTVTVTSWTGRRNFTACGQTGRFGPSSSQCSSAYSTTTLAGEVTVAGGVQAWTVPISGTYRIEARGARGGGADGGKGAYVRGDFSLTKGDTLYLIAGQSGGTSNQSCCPWVGGGGGGTFIYTSPSTTTPLLVAAGGGGSAESCSSTAVRGGHGSATTATTNSGTGGTGNGAGGTGGNGGKAGVNVDRFSTGAGGGGWLSNGQTGMAIRSPGGGGGLAPRNGATGGLFGHNTYRNADGGFGGGGGASDNTGAGGGGGGYNGGGGGNNYRGSCPPRWGAAGGAGSYNSGSNATATTGSNSGQGTITIDLL